MDDPEKISWELLAKRLGVTRQSLVNWRELEGAPTERDQATWEAFIRERGLGVKGPRSGSALKDEKTRHEIELLKAKLDREKRQVIPTAEVTKLLLTIATAARTKLYQFCETELPPRLDGMSAAQMRPILREVADSIADGMADEIGRFNQ